MDHADCQFCHPDPARIRFENDSAVAILDQYPVAACHTLIVPRRHVISLFDLAESEQAAVWMLVACVSAQHAAEMKPDGFTVGVNDGVAAGQTVSHAHVHIIPRRSGDVPDPRGGVR